jgi:hypothetical protein
MESHHNVLVLVTKTFAKNINATRILCLVVNANLEADGVVLV